MGACGSNGAGSPKPNLVPAMQRAQKRVGAPTISGRYFHLPKRIEDDYVLTKEVLGTGAHGSVFRARSRQTGMPVAVKGFHLAGISQEMMAELEAEVENFLSMDHPHVARLLGVYECNKHLNLVMECMEGGEVFDRVKKRKRFSEDDAAHAVWQMLLAVNYLHSQGVVHRDLKLENFMYDAEEGEFLKLIDFGLSHVWEPNTKMKASVGTIAYVAPEVLRRHYTSQCDLWSLGVISFILLAGYMPFFGPENKIRSAICRGHFEMKQEKWGKISDSAKDFVQSLLAVNPRSRLTAEQALQHPWIVKHDQSRPAILDRDASIVDALCVYAQTSRFRRACMSVMAWSLTREERASVRDAFIEIDKDGNGTICMSELKHVLVERFDITDDRIKEIFSALDSVSNEEIYYSEFLAAMVSTRIAMHDDLLTAAFRRFDVDSTGFITVDDFKRVLGDSYDGTEIEDLFKEASMKDEGRISYDDFIQHLKEGDATDKETWAADQLMDREMARRKTERPHSLLIDDDLEEKCMPEGFLGLKARADTGGTFGN